MPRSSRLILLIAATCAWFYAPVAQASTAANRHIEPASAALGSKQDRKEEYKTKRKAADGDTEKLWELHLWCEAYGLDREARSCCKAIVKLDKKHRAANEYLGYLEYDGKWFTNQKKLDDYKAAEELRKAEEQGLVRFNDAWVPKEDVPFLERGMIRDDNGFWVNKEDYEKLQAGWVQQDLVWVAPEEAENIKKGLWKCGEKWLPLKEANKYHANLAHPWVLDTDYFLLHTSCDRDLAEKITTELDRAYKHLARAFGVQPQHGKPVVAIVRNTIQYNQFANGEVPGLADVDSQGYSSMHHAFWADTWIDREKREYIGGGVGYWDNETDAGNAFGPYSVRAAAGFAYQQAVDPNLEGANALMEEGTRASVDKYYKGKQLPLWFRFGSAIYAERYLLDELVAAGGNTKVFREWAIANLLQRGGLRQDFSTIYRFKLSLEEAQDPDTDPGRLMYEAGLLVAFIVEGDCPPVKEAHAALKQALKNPETPKADLKKAIKALEKAVVDNRTKVSEFAGL